LFVVGGVFGEDFIDILVIFFGEIKVGFGCVVGCVDVLLCIMMESKSEIRVDELDMIRQQHYKYICITTVETI